MPTLFHDSPIGCWTLSVGRWMFAAPPRPVHSPLRNSPPRVYPRMLRPFAVALSFLLAAFPSSLHAEVTPGEILFSEMNCAACHGGPKELETRLASRPSPRLGPDAV